MKRALILFCIFSCYTLADHSSLGHNYSGRQFQCDNFIHTMIFSEMQKEKGGIHHYEKALCQLHRGQLESGIANLVRTFSAGSYAAAVALSEYYQSDGYKRPVGETTRNKDFLQRAIKYQEEALKIIRSHPVYPYDEESLVFEEKGCFYLRALYHLMENYMFQFSISIAAHLRLNEDIGNSTVQALEKS